MYIFAPTLELLKINPKKIQQKKKKTQTKTQTSVKDTPNLGTSEKVKKTNPNPTFLFFGLILCFSGTGLTFRTINKTASFRSVIVPCFLFYFIYFLLYLLPANE